MVSFFSSLGRDEGDWLLEQGTDPSQFAEVLSRNMIIIEELSSKQDGQKLECKTKKHGGKAEFKLLVICEYNFGGLLGISSWP